jgi:DNA repair protein RecN (Recombination protein N)
MLSELRIENFAIIQQLELKFSPGLIIFTGETGAGKSIILDALEAVVGGRTDPTNVRSGAERANVEAVFTIPAASRDAILEFLKREDLLDDMDSITLSREMRREGRSTARINGRSVAQNLLKELGSYLVDIHGQSEHLSLRNVRQHINLLDRYAHSESLLSDYQKSYRNLIALRKELSDLRQSEQDALRQTDMLTFQLNEIDVARLQEREEEELKQERSRLANAESLASLAQQALNVLDESSPEAPSLSDQAGQVAQALASFSRIDTSQTELANQSQNLMENISDMIHELQTYIEKIEYNPKRLEQVEERLDLLHNLQRKYGGSIEAVKKYAKDARMQLDKITHASERIADLEEQEKTDINELASKAQALSEKRQQAAESLSKAVENELTDLSMAGARFAADIRHSTKADGLPFSDGNTVSFDETGVDQVEFIIAPNPGEGLKPLVKIASGGETSRLMLALKNVLAKADFIPTLVFDEIDQGIGGRVGGVVGEKLWQLGRTHQVFCVTHLPQLAAFGDQHCRVRKEVKDGRTLTLVDGLTHNNRLDELSQMLGGVSEANAVAAREALQQAQQRQKSLSASDGRTK